MATTERWLALLGRCRDHGSARQRRQPLGFTKVTRDITEGKRARETFLLEVTNALVSNLDIRQLLSAVASCVRQVRPFDYATFALYDAPTKMLRMHVLEASAAAEAVRSGEEPLGLWATRQRAGPTRRGNPCY